MSMKNSLTIGKLAKEANVNVETIRFYEKKGLLTQPSKTESYRTYPLEYISRIHFIKKSQDLGFTLNEIKELLELRVSDQSKCCDVLNKTNLKISEIDKKIEDLKKMKATLESLAKCCIDDEESLSDCPILDCFLTTEK